MFLNKLTSLNSKGFQYSEKDTEYENNLSEFEAAKKTKGKGRKFK
jgi:hypothetical protein